VKLEPKYPFILDGSDKNERFLGDVWGGLSGDNGMIVRYKVRIDDNAITGTAPITLAYKYSDSPLWTSQDFNVNIRNIYDQVFIDSIEQKPQIVEPGNSAQIIFHLTNYGETAMNDVTVSIDLKSAEIPLVPDGEMASKRIKMLKSGETNTITFNIKADPKAKSQLYKVPITLKYYDILKNSFTKSDVLGIEIGSKPSLMVSLEKSEVYAPDSTGNIIIDIVNKGETDMKFLSITFLDSSDYTILEGQEQYIGNLDSDDFDTATLKLHLSKNSSSFKVPIVLEYKDALGNSYKENREVEIPIYSKIQALQFGLEKKSNTLGTIIVIVVVVLGFFTYKIFKRKKEV
jgi:hypothetical protein